MSHLRRGRIVWFVGLSGVGKTTLCQALKTELVRHSHVVTVLDGDQMRRGLCSDLGFSDSDRSENIRRIAHVADIVSGTGSIVLIATISPLQEFRDIARSILPEMLEVFVDAPLAVCERRDPKGLYRLARSGEITGFTGIDSPFEIPQGSEIVCHTAESTIEECTEKLLRFLESNAGQVERSNKPSRVDLAQVAPTD